MSRPMPQVWALYKEVGVITKKGMRVPERRDPALVRRQRGKPPATSDSEERSRAGARVFITISITSADRACTSGSTRSDHEVGEQMNLAYHYGANRIWM